jgi:glucan phosphoethanolaminetransferase (alkaline phosphatase superfamily)
MKNLIINFYHNYKQILLFLILFLVIPSLLIVWVLSLEVYLWLVLFVVFSVLIMALIYLLQFIFHYYIYTKIIFENLSIYKGSKKVEVQIIHANYKCKLNGVFIGEVENLESLKNNVLNILKNNKELRKSLMIILRNEDGHNLKLCFYVENIYIILSKRNDLENVKAIINQMATDTKTE